MWSWGGWFRDLIFNSRPYHGINQDLYDLGYTFPVEEAWVSEREIIFWLFLILFRKQLLWIVATSPILAPVFLKELLQFAIIVT